MQTDPMVTWLIPVKNGMPYLPLTLESIANQTYKNHKVLIWDDCSTDGSLEELRSWIPDRIPGQIFEGKSLKIGPCLAFLVEQADTELCARIDGDDIAYPQRLERQVAFLREHPDVAVLGTHTAFIDAEGTITKIWRPPVHDADARWQARYAGPVGHPSVMFRRSAVLAAGNYPSQYKFEDNALWTRMSLMKFEFANIPEPLTQYRRTDTSSTGLIEDWLPPFRQIAEGYASFLYPGITDPKEAMELWEATVLENGKVQTKFRHLKALKRAAIAHARQVGKPDDYFLNCDAYKEQCYHARRRILEGLGLGPLMRLRQRAPIKRLLPH